MLRRFKNFLKVLILLPVRLFYSLRVLYLYHFRLRPRLFQMKEFVNRIVKLKTSVFPPGKSIFVFQGNEDTIYFIVYKEDAYISIIEIYDEILNRIPERYQILPRFKLEDLIPGTAVF